MVLVVTLPFLGGVPRDESSTCLVSVIGKHLSQSAATNYDLDNRCFYSVLLPGVFVVFPTRLTLNP